MSEVTDRLKAKLLAKQENIKYLRFLCDRVMPMNVDDYQLDIWLIRFPVDIVSDSIQIAVNWYAKHHQRLEQAVAAGKMSQDEAFEQFKTEAHILAYATGCMKKHARPAEGKVT
jgi:hypothetical protein